MSTFIDDVAHFFNIVLFFQVRDFYTILPPICCSSRKRFFSSQRSPGRGLFKRCALFIFIVHNNCGKTYNFVFIDFYNSIVRTLNQNLMANMRNIKFLL